MTGNKRSFQNRVLLMCHTKDEMQILVDGKHIKSKTSWRRVNNIGFSLTILSLHSGINMLQLDNSTFGAIFFGQAEYESYAHLGGVNIPDKGNRLDEYPDDNLATWMPYLDSQMDQSDNFLDSELHLNKLIAGISVSVIVTIVLITKVILCMITLKYTNV